MNDNEKTSFWKAHILMLDFLLAEGVEITYREHAGTFGYCWLLPDGTLAGMSDTLAEVPPLAVDYILRDS